MTYNEARDILKTARNPAAGKSLENNTRLYQRGKDYAVQLHGTDVVTLHPDGSYTLDSGGWRTVTTKDRMRYAPHGGTPVASVKGVWQVAIWNALTLTYGPVHEYRDGMTVSAEGVPDTPRIDPKADKTARKLRGQIKRYARDYVAALLAGTVPAPSAADCWFCLMEDKATGKSLGELGNTNHLQSHLDEKYYVPSLLVRAVRRFPTSTAASHAVASRWQGAEPSPFFDNVASHQLQSTLRRYLYEQFGFQA